MNVPSTTSPPPSSSANVRTGNYVFAGGGTGGHLNPAIAVARALRKRDPGCGVLFIGSNRAEEQRIIGEAGYEHRPLPLLPRSQGWRHPIRFAAALWQSCQSMRREFEQFRPLVVIGCGGWASFPSVWAAHQLRVPIVLLEQNVLPGKGTRRLSRWSNVVCLSFEESRQWLPRGVEAVVTGNPVRAEIAALASNSNEPLMEAVPPLLLILGGSLGSQEINCGMLSLLADDPARWKDWELVHQTGLSDCERVRSEYQPLGLHARVEAFLPDVPELLARATLVVSRAGATTLAELACAGVAAVIAPWRGAADDHQLVNIEWYAQRNAMRLAEAELGRWEGLLELSADAEQRASLTRTLRTLARPQATEAVLRVLDSTVLRHAR